MKKLLLCSVLVVSGCVPSYKPGVFYTAPISTTLQSVQKTASEIYTTGSKPQDVKVKTIVVGLQKAQTQLTTVTATLDSQSKQLAETQAKIAAKNHRIFIDDCIFGVVALILLAPLIIKFLPLLAL